MWEKFIEEQRIPVDLSLSCEQFATVYVVDITVIQFCVCVKASAKSN